MPPGPGRSGLRCRPRHAELLGLDARAERKRQRAVARAEPDRAPEGPPGIADVLAAERQLERILGPGAAGREQVAVRARPGAEHPVRRRGRAAALGFHRTPEAEGVGQVDLARPAPNPGRRSTLPSLRAIAATQRLRPELLHACRPRPRPRRRRARRSAHREVLAVREGRGATPAVGSREHVEGAAHGAALAQPYAPAIRRSLSPPRLDSVSNTGTGTSRSTTVSSDAR